MRLNLTEQIRLSIVDGIIDGRYPPGGKLPTEREYAEVTGASRVTIRRAYDQLESAGIIVRSRPQGTRVADTFSHHPGPIENIGLITTLPHDFSGRFVEAVCRHVSAIDALPVLGIPDPDPGGEQLKIAIKMATRGIRDLVVWGADRSFDFTVFERLKILGVNMVFYDQVIPGAYADYVGLDNCDAIAMLLDRAFADGAEEFRFLTRADLDVDTNAEREAAFIEHLSRRNAKFEIIRVMPQDASRYARELAIPPVKKTAYLAVNAPTLQMLFPTPVDNATLCCVDCTREALALGAICCRQPIDEMAAAAVESLCLQRKGKTHSRIRRFKGEFVTQ